MQAATRRANPRAEEEFDGEPNIRLSSAIAVVLVLHVVAVSGIYAFNRLKEHRLPEQPPAAEKKAVEPLPQAEAAPAMPAQQPVAPAQPVAAAPSVPAAPVVEAPAKPVVEKHATKAAGKDSGKSYTVAKGDNPVAIAKRFKVSYEELLKLNNIKDPRKLQIGQKLHLPASH